MLLRRAYTGPMRSENIGFIGGGHMASALIGGLIKSGRDPATIVVVEPFESQRARLKATFSVNVLAAPDAQLARAVTWVWAVKPQMFAEAAAPCTAYAGQALHLSVMAGIRSEALVRATGSERIVRAMPNTPALIGQGIAGLYAREAVGAAERDQVQALLAPTGATLWVAQEDDLDAVTALSGSGPAYVFYFIEAMIEAAVAMGLSVEQGRQLAQATFAGATALAQASTESPATLREQVTSKGGTTHAAITSMQADGIGAAIVKAIRAAQARARELGAS